jgi:hypothetical protein
MIARTFLYERLLPTLGSRALPALFRRLRKAAGGDDEHLVELAAGAIAAIGGEGAGREAVRLLNDPSPFVQRAAMKVLAGHPAPGCLDRLWEIHCAVVADGSRFLKQGEHRTVVYNDSFGALLACVKLEPSWLSAAVRKADTNQPVHDLAYLLGNLDGQEPLWLGCKPFLFEKVDPRRERSLASNIFRHRDAQETQWLIERVGREDDLLGPCALRALCRIDPDAAVRELPRLPIPLWGMTSRWCFAEILRQRPDEARVCVRRMLDRPGAAQVVTVYQDDPGAVDVTTLDVLLDRLSELLAQELRGTPELPSSSPAFSVLCQLLPRLNRLEHLACFERRQGSILESRLTYWLLRRGPIPGQFAHPDQEDVLRILVKVGGKGSTRVINRHLNSTNFYARIGALKDAPRRPDWETVAHLVYLSQKDEVHETAGPVEQGHAALALAAVGEYDFATDAVIRWGLRTLVSAVQRLASMPSDEKALARALTALDEGGDHMPGAILAVGTARQSGRREELAERVRSLLSSAPKESDVAHACVIALWLLGDRSDEMVALVAPHLDVPAHRHYALEALLGADSDPANDALLAHLGRCFDTGLAIHLLNQNRTSRAVAPLVRGALEKGQPYERSKMTIMLLLGVRDSRALEEVIDDPSAREALHETAFASAERGVVWFVGSRAAAVRHLARFDAQTACEAARAALEETPGKDREQYPDLLAEIDPLGAAPYLLDRLRVETDRRVRWAIGRSFAGLTKWPAAGVQARLSSWFASGDPERRRAACEVAGWLSGVYTLSDPALHARLNDVDERVAAAAQEAMARLRDAEHVWELARAIVAELDEARRWRLLDALIALADPGDEHQPVPQWSRQVEPVLSPAMRNHLREGLKRRRKELVRESERN